MVVLYPTQMAAPSLSLFPWKYSFATFTTSPRITTRKFSSKMAINSICATLLTVPDSSRRKLPIFLFDVMDTLVRDPFYEDVPAFFRMSMKELLECKDPTVWIEFEKGLIDEPGLARNFFKDRRSFDLEGLKDCMKRGYSYIEGVEELLCALKKNGYEIHAFTNYPIWYQMIEDKLKLSTYLSWTFCSCIYGKRKPDADFYLEVLKYLDVEPGNCIFIDDRMRNVEAGTEVGFRGLQFKGVDSLRNDLSILGIDISKVNSNEDQDLPASIE